MTGSDTPGPAVSAALELDRGHRDEGSSAGAPADSSAHEAADGAGSTLSPAARDLLSPQARELRAASRSQATRDAYASDWARFSAWCHTADHRALPASAATVANYLADCAPTWRAATADELARGGDRVQGTRYRDGVTPATLRRRLVAIRHQHLEHGHPDPTAHRDVREVLAGITHCAPAAGRKVAAAATEAPLLAMLATTADPDPSLETAADDGLLSDPDLRADPRDARDAAILTVGMVGALRRSELAALRVGDIRFVPAGVEVYLQRSKTDQTGRGHVVDLPTLGGPACPVAALRRWLQWLPTATPQSPLFRRIRRDQGGDPARRISDDRLSARSVADVVTHRAALAQHGRHGERGLPGQWSGHSLRRGFATGAYAGGVDEVEIMRHGRWRSASTMRGYLEEGTRFRPTHAAYHLFPDPPGPGGAHGT